MDMYESDVTKFIRELLQKNSRLAEEQKKARAIWWDKQVDFEEQKRAKESEVPQPPYVYFDNLGQRRFGIKKPAQGER